MNSNLVSSRIYLFFLLTLICGGSNIWGQVISAEESFYKEALNLRGKGDFQSAYEMTIRSDSLLQSNPHAPNLLRAQVKHLQGLMLYNLNLFPQAIGALQSADSIYAVLQDFGGRADCYLFIGNSIWYLEGAEAALKQFDLAIQFAQRDDFNTRQYRGKYYLDKAYAYGELGKFKESFLWLNKGLEMDRAHFGETSKQYAEALMVQSVMFNYQGDYYKSAQGLESALQIQQNLNSGENIQHLAPIYGNLAVTYFYLGDLDEAERYSLKTLAAYRSILEGEHNQFGMIYLHLGDINVNRNQPEEAMEWYRKADLVADTNDINLQIGLRYGWGLSLHNLGRYAEADSIYKVLRKSSEEFYGAEHSNVAVYYENFANNLLALDSVEASLRALDKVAAINRALFPPGHITEARILALKANVYWTARFYEKAIETSEAGLQIFEGKPDALLMEHHNIYYTLHHSRARSFLQKSGQDPLKAVQASLVSYRALEAISDRILREERSMDARQRTLSNRGNLYEEMLQALHQLSRWTVPQNEEMWRIVEKSKAMILLDGIRKVQMPMVELVLDSIQRTTAAYNFYQKKIFDAMQQPGTADEDAVIQWQSAAFDLETRRRLIWKVFREENPVLSDNFEPGKNIRSLQYVQDTLLQSDQALLEYFVGDSSIFLFVVKPDTFLVEEIPYNFPLEDCIEGLRKGLYGYYAAGKEERSDPDLQKNSRKLYLENAQFLYEKLFAPVAQFLPEKVIIVPDGPLGYIPFDALLDRMPENEIDFKSYPYLLKKYQFSYVYSATLLREMREKKHRQEPRNSLLGFAPFLSSDTTNLKKERQTVLQKGFDPLPYSKIELELARQKMGGDIVTGSNALLSRFLAVAGQYRILHLATHGVADNRVGDYAYLVFNKHPDSAGYSLLYVKDLYNLSLNADLVVLSACETGIGKLQRGEGIISLARAFAYAGAKSILTSLWSVSNKSTSELMALFYEELSAGRDKDAALRKARQRYIENATVRNAHPFFWAAFVPVGDMRRVK